MTHYGTGYNTNCMGLKAGSVTTDDKAKVTCQRCLEFIASRERTWRGTYAPTVTHFGHTGPMCRTQGLYPKVSIDAAKVNCARCKVKLYNLAMNRRPVTLT